MRNRVMYFVVCLAGALGLVSCSWMGGGQEAVQFHLNPAAYQKIDALCQGIVNDGYAPGAVLLVGVGDKVLMRKAYGYRMKEPTQEKMTVNTLFDMASLTKATATASAVMLLVQDGKMKLSDHITKYVPEFRNTGKPDITIKQLLTHDSGLPAYTSEAYLEKTYGPGPNPDALIKRIASLDRVAPPGTKYVYSCLNYLTLARAVQNVTKENMDTFLRKRLWGPLGMKDTTFFPNKEQTARTAPTIYKDGVLRQGKVHDPLAHYSDCASYASGNAGEFSTVDDMSKYVRMILHGGELNGHRIFRHDIWEEITTNQAPEGLKERSCGWGVWSGDKAYGTPLNQTPDTCTLGHTGYTGTIVWMDKLSKAYVILFTNCVYPDDKGINKREVIQARRKVISTVLDNMDIYKGLRGEAVASN